MFQILNKLFSKQELNELATKLVIQEDNIYTLFGEYELTKTDKGYTVTKNHTDLVKYFFSPKNAVVWTSLYKRSKLADAERVETLDKILEGTVFNIDLYQHLYKKAKNLDSQTMYRIKMEESKAKRKLINEELEDYIKNTRAWQEKQFKEAIK